MYWEQCRALQKTLKVMTLCVTPFLTIFVASHKMNVEFDRSPSYVSSPTSFSFVTIFLGDLFPTSQPSAGKLIDYCKSWQQCFFFNKQHCVSSSLNHLWNVCTYNISMIGNSLRRWSKHGGVILLWFYFREVYLLELGKKVLENAQSELLVQCCLPSCGVRCKLHKYLKKRLAAHSPRYHDH